MKIALLVILLSGCVVWRELPTTKYCDTVKYERVGQDITVTAHCTASVAGN